VLATVNEDGQPTTRAIEVRSCDDRGLVFFASLRSRKGRDLRARARDLAEQAATRGRPLPRPDPPPLALPA
jgi:pyridoxine/pyridoxamine 5'-phosphate oxidase